MTRLARLSLPMALTALLALVAPIHAQESGAAENGTWTYGAHPLWGLSASVTVGGESVGLRCLPDRGFAYPAAALLVTPGLVRPHPNFAPTEAIQRYRFVGDPAMGEGMIAQVPGGYFELKGSTCDVSLDSFKAARALLFYDETADVMALDDATAERAPGLIARIPLDGAKAAIDKLVRACPAIRKDIQNGCGI